MIRPILIAALTLLTLSLGGCGKDPDHELQRAKLAMANNRPDSALNLVASVLEARPDDPEALLVRAEAQTRLLNFKGASNTLRRLMALPLEGEIALRARRLCVVWSFANTFNLLRKSDFITNAPMQEEFDQATAFGREQAAWLADKGGRPAEAEFVLARLAMRGVARAEMTLEQELKNLANLDPEGNPVEGPGTTLGTLRQNIDQGRQDARKHLLESLKHDPAYAEATADLAMLLRRESDWAELWHLADNVAKQTEVPENVASELILGMLQTPNTQESDARKLEVGWQLLNLVPVASHARPGWQLAAARLHLQANEFAKAQPLLEEASRNAPNDLNIPYLLARTLLGLDQPKAAKDILDKAISKAGASSQMQLLYGTVLLRTGDRALAKEAFRRATDLDPENSQARQMLIQTLAAENALDAVERDVEELLAAKPNDPQALRLKLQLEQARGGHSTIDELLQRVAAILSPTPEHLRLLVDGHTYRANHSKAEEFARRLVQAQGDKVENHLLLAGTLLNQNRDDQARTLLESLRDKFPDNPDIDSLMGRLYLSQRRYDRAQEVLDRVVSKAPSNVEARLSLAQALAGLAMVEDATEQINRALEQSPNNVRAVALLAAIHEMTGERSKADEALARIDENQVSEQESPVLKAQLLARRNQLDEAAAVCNRAIAAGNADPMLRRLLAVIHTRAGQLDQAEFHLLALVRSQPQDAAHFLDLTRWYIANKLAEKGLAEFQKLQMHNEPLARLSQASLLASMGRFDDALSAIEPIQETLIRKRERTALAVAEAGARLHLAKGHSEKAKAMYDRLLQADLFPFEARLNLIDLQAERSDPARTLEQLDELARSLTIEQSRLRLQVIQRYTRLGRPDRVLAMLNQWIQERPDSWQLLQIKAGSLQRLGRFSEALPVLEKAITLSPENLSLRLDLATAHIGNFDFPKAHEVLEQTGKLDTGARITALAGQGQLFIELGLMKEAGKVYDTIEKLGRPTDPRVNLAMGLSLNALGQTERARERLSAVPVYASQYVGAQVELARMEQAALQVDEARTRLEALASDPRHAAAASRELVRLQAQNRQFQELIRFVDRALAEERLSQPERDAWLRTRVFVLADSGDWLGVLKTLDRLVEMNPASPELAGARIAVMMRLSQIESANQAVAQSAALSRHPLAALLRGASGTMPGEGSEQLSELDRLMLALARGDRAAASAALEALPPMRSMFKDDLLTLINRPDFAGRDMTTLGRNLALGMVAMRTGLPQLAADVCRGVIKANPAYVPAYSLMLDALSQRGEPLTEVRDAVLKNLPSSSVALLIASREKVRLLDHAGAAADLRRLLERVPDHETVRYELASALSLSGEIDASIKIFEELWSSKAGVRMAAGNDLAYLLTEHRSDRLDDAYAIAQEVHSAAPTSVALLDTLGWIQHKRGLHDEALKLLSRALPPLKSLPEVHYHIGRVYAALGNKAWARYHFEQAASDSSQKTEVSASREALKGL